MATPTVGDVREMKMVLRYLLGCPRYIYKFDYQKLPENISAHAHSDFAGCVASRKSILRGIMFVRAYTIKSWSTSQAVVALSSGEAEYHSIVKGASNVIGLENLMKDLGY